MMRGAGRFHTRSKRPATPRGECDGRLLCSGPARHAHALVSQGHARTTARARVGTSRAAAAGSTRHVVRGHATPRGECDGRLLGSGPARHAHALVSQGDARTSARARFRTSHARAAAAASTRRGFSAVNQSPAKQHKRHAHAGAAGATGQPARGRHAPRCAAADARSAGRGSGLAALPWPSQCRPEKGPV